MIQHQLGFTAPPPPPAMPTRCTCRPTGTEWRGGRRRGGCCTQSSLGSSSPRRSVSSAGGGGGERGWTAAAGRHRRRRKRASTTAGRSGSGVAVGAAARRRADVGGKGLFWIATRVVSRGNGRGGASTPPAVDPLVRPAYAQSAPTPRVRGSGVVAGCLRAMARLPRCFLVTAVAAVGTAATAKLCIQ